MSYKTLYRKLSRKYWNIGFLCNPIDDVLNGQNFEVRWLEHNFKDRWFADPFILEVTKDDIIVLVEEYYIPEEKGRLSKLTIDKKTFHLLKTEPFLTLDTHLSFPIIKREDDSIYIYPENSEGGGLWLYDYDYKNNVCKRLRSLCSAPVTDAVITDLFGKTQLFSTVEPNANGDVLGIYEQSNESDEFILTKEIKFNGCIARNAGDWFLYNGKVYRPAQECNICYGHSLSLQEVTFENDNYVFKEIRRIESPHPSMKIAFHTFNIYKNYIVVDCEGWRYGTFGKIIYNLRKKVFK